MRTKTTLVLLLAGAACLLLAGCQTKDNDIPETTFRSLLKLVPSDPGDDDSFGMAVAVDGDYALVGSPGEDGDGTNRGAAYLFLQSQGGLDNWGEVKKLVASDTGDDDIFGISVAISGDYAAVGAAGENGFGTDRGAAYIFYRNQGGADNWGQVKKITASDAADADDFGFAVALDGDTLIVGADGEDGSGTDRGAAYIFYRNQGGADNWGQVAKLADEDPEDANQFGYSVAIDGDVALVGSPGEHGDGTNRGAALLFSRDQGGADNWGELHKLTASDAHNSDLFGYDVAVDGDFIAVGAGWSQGGGTERGQAYLFSRNEGGTDNWGEVQRLRASDGANNDWFGFSLSLDGLYLLVGATGEDGEGSGRGAAYMFRKLD
jgi:hypothetical protein